MFALRERPASEIMRGLLCRAFLEFTRMSGSTAGLDAAGCDAEACPGPGHLRVWSDAAASAIGVPAPLLLERFGKALFERLARGYPAFFVGIESTADLIGRYQTHVAEELRKLDGDARPPQLFLVRREGEPIEVVYRSPQRLGDLARGMLCGSIAYFREPLVVGRSPAGDTTAEERRFRLQPRA